MQPIVRPAGPYAGPEQDVKLLIKLQKRFKAGSFYRPFLSSYDVNLSTASKEIDTLKREAYMGVLKSSEVTPTTIAPGRRRYLAHLSHLMMVVMDIEGGPALQPDPPHSHPHEQISYVVSGEINLVLNDQIIPLQPGDIFTVPSNVPHSIQLLTPKARLVDTFTPIREEFL